MGLLIDDIKLAWSSLRDSTDITGWRSITIASIGSCSLRAGLSFPERSEALLAGFTSALVPADERLPHGQGFAVSRPDPDGDGLVWLSLTRNEHGSAELFTVMVSDICHAMVAESSEEEWRLLRVFLGRISAWQEFMRRGSQGLNAESEIGLVGELTLLRAIIASGMTEAAALESWVGPLGGVRDFELGTGSLEVKATLAATGFPAKIGSLDQLDDSLRQPLFLAGAQLRQTQTGQSLPELVAEIRIAAAGDAEALRLVGERLIAAGYLDVHADRYVRRYTLANIRVVEVKDDFPRLTRGSIPLGITKASYEIDLDKVEGPNIPVSDALRRLGAI